MTNNDIVVEQTIAASLDRVWKAWTDASQTGIWFAAGANIVPVRGGAYELFWDLDHPERDSTLGCRVTILRPGKCIGFTWRGPSIFDDLMNEEASSPVPPTHVIVQFEPLDNRTLVRVTHGGWETGARWVEARTWHLRAWAGVMQNLMAFLEGRTLPIDWKAIRKNAGRSEQ
jgi:uncharacterized protein YndB with AHSA1/START domain